MPYGIGIQKGIKPVEVLESIWYNDAPKIIVMTPGGLFGESQIKMNRRTFLKTAGAGLSAMMTLDCVMSGDGVSSPNILFFYPDQHPDIVGRLKPLLPPVGPYRNLKRQAKKDSPGYTQYPCREKKPY